MAERLDVSTARELLDFAAGASGGVVSAAVAEEQLLGAVAIHNMLEEQQVAYLADEVGMGKTYVALGAMALLRHFHPHLRVLVLAPKQNIQDKWIKEWRNFVARVVRVEDLRVKALAGHPARALVKAPSLVDLVTETANDPDRDFFARLTSFSLSMAGSGESLDRRRETLLRVVPWLPRELLDTRNRERYKRNFACAVNCALPDIDLLIVDEAHNLKAGWREGSSSSIRNTVLGVALGGRATGDDIASTFKGYGRRVKRVLFLSATPIEDDVRQLWNQLDLFGFGDRWKALCDSKLTFEEQRDVVRKLLIRRSAELHAGGKALTKSEYRREWRAGGITMHDEKLALVSDRQRLAVALVQKKVSELLGSATHNHSFQVGLLASFESFLETVKNTSRPPADAEIPDDETEGGDAAFHRTPEEIAASREDRKDGVDIDAINEIARDHRRTFSTEMPHPKMDAIVGELAASFETGRKALVFVRRVASVDELQRKLEDQYDDLIFAKLRRELRSPSLQSEIEQQIAAYRSARAEGRHRLRARDAAGPAGDAEAETSSVDSFFAWFFRGEGPSGVRSGASIAEQLDKVSGTYVTLLEDNYVADLLGVPSGDVVSAFARALGLSEPEALRRLAEEASRFLGPAQKRLQRRVQMRAVQAAALSLLASDAGQVGERALIILQALFDAPRLNRPSQPVADVAEWLSTPTLFSELRRRTQLCEALWPQPTEGTFIERLREQEVRREFISTMIRKGHGIVDLFVLIANRLGTLKQRSRESVEADVPGLESEILDELERQQREEAGRFNSFRELADSAASFALIVQLNVPELLDAPFARIPTVIGKTLRAQRPVAGMAGKVNGELVKQFRMPGYPLVLITTDLLKEGEDLHTFCSSVYHYGIAWMPSELEQRVGRIDRVGSQTERRLAARSGTLDGADLLQVYYPHLSDTVEVLQLRRVYERLNRFLLTMHEGLGVPAREKADVSVIEEGIRHRIDIKPISVPLRSAFPVPRQMLIAEPRRLAVTEQRAKEMHARFARIEQMMHEMGATDVRRSEGQIVGEMHLPSRVQPFTLMLRSLHGRPLLRCVSPVGRIDEVDWDDDGAARLATAPFVRIAIEYDRRFSAYDVAVEGDVLLGPSEHDLSRAKSLISSVIHTADRIEDQLLHADAKLADVAPELDAEVTVER
jgi:hypothetical protein